MASVGVPSVDVCRGGAQPCERGGVVLAAGRARQRSGAVRVHERDVRQPTGASYRLALLRQWLHVPGSHGTQRNPGAAMNTMSSGVVQIANELTVGRR